MPDREEMMILENGASPAVRSPQTGCRKPFFPFVSGSVTNYLMPVVIPPLFELLTKTTRLFYPLDTMAARAVV